MTAQSISSIEIRRAGNDEFYFVFRLPGNRLFVSHFFDNMSEVVAVVEYSQRNSKNEARYLCKTRSLGEDYFLFLTKNNKPIGQSTMFEKKPTMRAGLLYMQKHFQTAEVADFVE